MTALNEGEVEIVLNGNKRVLRPTLNAITQISRLHNGMNGVTQALVNSDFDAVVAVVRHGLGIPDREATRLPAEIYKNGLTQDLVIACINYVSILTNGGRPRADVPPETDDETPAGND
jgi:virulence-associated protein VagC